MKKMIYAVKKGRKTGIFKEWLKCSEQTNRYPNAKFRSFKYRSELETAAEDVPGSLRHAIKEAEEYMEGLVYLSGGDYLEDESWKKDGYLPFVKGRWENGILFIEDESWDDGELPFGDESEAAAPQSVETVEGDTLPFAGKPGAEEPGFIEADNAGELPYAEAGGQEEEYSGTAEEESTEKESVEEYEEGYGEGSEEESEEGYVEESEEGYVEESEEGYVEESEEGYVEESEEGYGEEYGEEFEEGYEEEYGEEYDERPVDSGSTLGLPTGYWKMVEDMAQDVEIIMNREGTYCKCERSSAAKKLRQQLEECLADVNLNRLTAFYRDERSENVLGYRPSAVAIFVKQMRRAYPRPKPSEIVRVKEKAEEEASMQQLLMQAGAIESELREKIVGQDAAIEKLRTAYFDRELSIRLQPEMRGPRDVYLLAGPPGVGKTFMAQQFAHKLGFPFKRFDMSGYTDRESSIFELLGFPSTYRASEPGILTEFVTKNPKCVLLFDEVEKADISVIRLFLQILDAGICEDKFHKRDVPFKDAIIFFTTNAGRQLYHDARNENLSMLPDRVVKDALEKDIDQGTHRPLFPPEILSRMSSYTIIMLNHLKADAIGRLVKRDIEVRLERIKKEYGYEPEGGEEYLAQTVLYSMGGNADARNASKAAGKLIDKEMYELLQLVEEKQGLDESGVVRKIEWKCDLEDATEEIKTFYFGERDCVIPVFGTVKYEPAGKIKCNNVHVKSTGDIKEFMEMIHKENVLFAVIDYLYGLEDAGNRLSVVDAWTIGRDVFLTLREEDKEIPVYILEGSHGHFYTEKEKKALIKKGAGGFIESGYFERQLEQIYMDVCCQVAMETLTVRHQALTYETKKEFDATTNVGSIVFCDFRLETAVESEDKSSMLSDDLRPNKSWEDIYVSTDLKEELEFFIEYLRNPKKYKKKGVKPRGILLYGPPGTGKTSLAKVAASESGVNFLSVSASEFLNGGPEKVQDEFRIARKYAPAILFIDEIDAIGMKRENSYLPNPVLNTLLTEMDGFKNTDGKPVFVMAATNRGSDIDSALQRRFDRTFEMGCLDEKGRRWQLEKLINKQSDMFALSDEEMKSIVDRSERTSPAKLEQAVEAALREGIRSDRVIDDDLFDEVFEKCMMGEERTDSSPERTERVAYHEAGHALISLYYDRPVAYISIVARGGKGGYTLSEAGEEDSTKEYCLETICLALGGRAAEMVFQYGLTYGAVGDLKRATDIAENMVCRFGMYEKEIGLAVIKKEDLKYNEKAQALINGILSEQLSKAISIIEANQDAMKRLVKAVMKNGKRYLTGKEIREAVGRLNKK